MIRLYSSCRRFSTTHLRSRLEELIPQRRHEYKVLKSTHGEKIIDKVSVNQVLGGMRGIKSLFWDTSQLDANKGIMFHGLSIPELKKQLPTFTSKNDSEPTVESMLWFLLTKEIPNPEQTHALSLELEERATLPSNVVNMIHNLPKNTHPMTQLSLSILMLQNTSEFAIAYSKGVSKEDYWKYCYEDIMNIIAKLPQICALIYQSTYSKELNPVCNESLDYAGNFCQMLGFNDPKFHELMRLYLVIHSDHEGGNASAHTCRLVGSTLADPYLSLSSSMNALAGPLHGLANQEVLKWLNELQKTLDESNIPLNDESIEKFVWDTLNKGMVIPGYGHAVLRITDPRYTVQREFALKHLENDELFQLINKIYSIMPNILKAHGKTKNPYPNVDFHSGVLLKHYGLHEYEFYTVLFGLGRSLGVLSQLFWDRAINLPLERPKSLNVSGVKDCISGEIMKDCYEKMQRKI